ncbi:Z1 domain-containing protein [Tsukamurella sp. 1534]|uniref:Z1 domain-containing protein n=1 Tax=Tsukamurella sp. 1534 TaxID=1151061 RepID=UPI0005933060|nr:Z1 domain-containing protein [Tsukamurella sp. 1534]
MIKDPDKFYNIFATWAMQNGGPRNAADYFLDAGMIDDAQADDLINRFETNRDRVSTGGPVIKPRHEETWYQGALDSDRIWGAFKEKLINKGRETLIPDLDESSNTIVGLTPNPTGDARSARGLVVGFIQSGKTTNFTAVAAKLADRRYRMVIVLAGIHNALRRQTQARLNNDLASDPERWFVVTGEEGDFDLTRLSTGTSHKHDATAYLTSQDKTTLLVVKKNAAVLRKLLLWLNKPSAKNALRTAPVLVIDDEADQASVETGTINPLIRDLLALFPRGTYIGYTATPFANVFINPADSDDLYPRDFIYPLPQPDGYFGPETLFGRESTDLDNDGDSGKDMIRLIPDADEFKLRPMNKKEADGFVPVVTAELRAAIHWFLLATTARWVRGDASDSSMLIHTSFQTQIHHSYTGVVESVLRKTRSGIVHKDPEVVAALAELWADETARVDACDWGRQSETFDELLTQIVGVIDDTRVIMDNYLSDERLAYHPDQTNTIIAIGGNTLSRGITLEGLVSSVFLRPTNTYDSLLQMGRWFGFRPGYEDLPRIWTTNALRDAFRHLSLVEYEMRQDMAAYEIQGITPMEAAVRIRTHPSLRVTAKMGAAQPSQISFGGARLQTRYFLRRDREWLDNNWAAGEQLVAYAKRFINVEPLDNGVLLRNVNVASVRSFLGTYSVVPKQADMDLPMILEYVRQQNELDEPRLTKWNIAVVGGSGPEVTLAGESVKRANRAPYADSGDLADIKTLMSKADLVVDVPSVSLKEARDMTEAALKVKRIQDEETQDKGLIVLYPIDENSVPKTASSEEVRGPMDAVAPVLGLAIVFPKTTYSASERDAVQSTHLAVELSQHAEVVDTSDEMYGVE